MSTVRTATPTLGGRAVALVGSGFFAVSAAMAVFNAYMPLMLDAAGLTTAAIGVVMALDNVFGVTVQPLAGMVSDHVRSPWGRRIPFALAVAPVSALALLLIPWGAGWGIGVLVGLVVLYTITMAGWRAPIVALMPDLVESRGRSRANGIINVMGALGSALIFATGGMLPRGFGYQGPFTVAAVLVAVAVLVLVLFVREPASYRSRRFSMAPLDGGHGDRGMLARVLTPPSRLGLSAPQRRSLVLILVVIFAYTIGANAVETFMTLYLTRERGVAADQVTALLLPYLAAGLLWAVPAGLLGQRFGRRASIGVALAGAIVLFFVLVSVDEVGVLVALLPLYGALWITIVVNALPLVLEMGGSLHTGTMTAYYYLATGLGSIAGPIGFGLLRDATGSYGSMFWWAAGAFLLAGLFLTRVRHGEASPSED